MTFRVFFFSERCLCFRRSLSRLLAFQCGLGPAVEQAQRAADHAHGMKHERADQVDQRVVAFGTGDDRSHDPDHSDNADDPQQDAKNA